MLSVDWSAFAATAPFGLLGFAVTGVAAGIAIKANGGLVRVAEKLVDAVAGQHQPPQAPVGGQPGNPDAGVFPETEPAGTHDVEEFPPPQRADTADEFPPHG